MTSYTPELGQTPGTLEVRPPLFNNIQYGEGEEIMSQDDKPG